MNEKKEPLLIDTPEVKYEDIKPRNVYIQKIPPQSEIDNKKRTFFQKIKYLVVQDPEEISTNKVETTKYKWWSFIPKNLFEQFYYRHANIYFLLIAILTLIPGLSPVGSFGNMLMLVIVVLVQMAKDLLEDVQKLTYDRKTNRQKVEVFKGVYGFVSTAWMDINIGDIIRIKNKDKFPCDLLLLDTSDPTGACFVETSSLDGETNLKYKKSTKETHGTFLKDSDITKFGALVTCEPPNKDMYVFNGNLELKKDQKIPLSSNNLLLRGSSLRNTDWIIGAAIYLGKDTKLMKNRKETPHKRSQIDIQVNRYIYLMFIIELILCLCCVVGLAIWSFVNDIKHWYLGHPKNRFILFSFYFDLFKSFFTFLILFSNLLPISLYVSMETAKLLQGFFIEQDKKLFYEETGTMATVRTSSINEDLGQVRFIFSDKTGTLTANEMKFLKCTISGIKYGTGLTEISRAAAKRTGKQLVDDRPSGWDPRKEFQFYDKRINDGEWKKQDNKEDIAEFFELLSICHTVIPEKPQGSKEIIYSAASPDEFALVSAAKFLGFDFYDRDLTKIITKVEGKDKEYEVLDIIEFDSDRKRMSVICKTDGKIFVYCKGADNVLWSIMAKNQKGENETKVYVDEFANDGLRTLLCGKREIKKDEWESLSKEIKEAKEIIIESDRNKKLSAVYSKIEKDLKLVGCTAVEDKLQEGVPYAISELKEADIKIWVLTGDKLDTAINIGYACDLLNNDMQKYVIDDDLGEDLDKLREAFKDFYEKSKVTKNQAIIITGKVALKNVLENEDLKDLFLRTAIECQAVVCCRVSPSQKAEVVLLVKDNIDSVTLAIGDGGNDVPMIQSAHVGVGIAGKEGLQAANAADFSFSQFKYLKPLLLIHGRWSYRRISKLILYSFYKNCVLYLTQFWFVFLNGFSGNSIHDRWTVAFFNGIFTAFPIMAIAVFDRDLNSEVADDYPRLYLQGHKKEFFNFWIYLGTVLNGIFHSALCFYLPIYFLSNLGILLQIDKFSIGVAVYTSVVLVVTGKVSLETASFTFINVIIIIASVLSWFLFVLLYGVAYYIIQWNEVYDFLAMYQIFGVPMFWVVVLFTTVACLLRDIVWKAAKRYFSKNLYYQLPGKIGKVDKHELMVQYPLGGGLPVKFKKNIQLPVKTPSLKELNQSLKKYKIRKYTGFAFAQTEGSVDILKSYYQSKSDKVKKDLDEDLK